MTKLIFLAVRANNISDKLIESLNVIYKTIV